MLPVCVEGGKGERHCSGMGTKGAVLLQAGECWDAEGGLVMGKAWVQRGLFEGE